MAITTKIQITQTTDAIFVLWKRDKIELLVESVTTVNCTRQMA